MKVLIFYAKYGGGHLSTAKAIKETIENNYNGIDVEMCDCMEYVNKAINKISTDAYTEMARKAPKMWGEVYKHSNKGPISSLSKTSNRIFALKLYSLIEEINPDIIISAHPFSTQMCTFLKKHNKINVKIANILTDYMPHEQWLIKPQYIDYFFVSNDVMKEKLIEHGIEERKIFALGIPISERFSKKYDKNAIFEEFKLQNGKKTILFFAGGKYGLATKNVYDFIESLSRDFEDIQVVAISGENKKILNKFNKIVEMYNKQDSIKVVEFTDKVPELMSISNLVITKPRRNHYIRKYGNAEYQLLLLIQYQDKKKKMLNF